MGAQPCPQGRTCPPASHWGGGVWFRGPCWISSECCGSWQCWNPPGQSQAGPGWVVPHGVVQAGQAAWRQEGEKLQGCKLFGRALFFLHLCCWEDAEP